MSSAMNRSDDLRGPAHQPHVVTDRGRRSGGWHSLCVIDVCSAVPVPHDTGWHHLAGAGRDSRYRATKNGTEWCRKTSTDIT
jgi:hypothetical protein